jgi:hypothetical protein
MLMRLIMTINQIAVSKKVRDCSWSLNLLNLQIAKAIGVLHLVWSTRLCAACL